MDKRHGDTSGPHVTFSECLPESQVASWENTHHLGPSHITTDSQTYKEAGNNLRLWFLIILFCFVLLIGW